jgi:hypothetical protein
MEDVCGDGSQVTGTSLLTLTGGALPSGASGTFEVRLVVPEGVQGSYRNTTGAVRGRVGGLEPISGVAASDDLVVEAGEGRSGSIGDFIWYDDDGDGIQNDAPSSGIVGVTVNLLTGACPGSPAGSTTTSNDGAYEFTELEPGDYCVDVDEGSITLPIPQATAVLTTGNEPLTVTLSAGERFVDADFGYDTFPVATEHTSNVPQHYDLHTNYPNPFNPTTMISYDLPEAAAVTLTVVGLVGRTVRALASGMKPAGTYEVSFDATTLPSGVYFYRLEAGDYVDTRPMVVVR